MQGDRAVLDVIDDDAAVNGCRPEFVRLGDRDYLATADYGDVRPEVRLYDPQKLVKARRSSAPGVVVHRVLCGPFNQNLHWDARRGQLTCVQNVIAGRAEALNRFVGAYTQLARLPQPRLGPVDVGTWIRRVAGLETRVPVRVQPGPATVVQADGDLLDQLLINLLRNAADAAAERLGAAAGGASGRRVKPEGGGMPRSAKNCAMFSTEL